MPYCVFDSETLEKMPAGSVIFELASNNAGVDIHAAEICGIRVIPLPSLPGKTSPQTSGEIIASVIGDELVRYFGGGDAG